MEFSKMFSSDGGASWARFGSFMALVCSLVWITFVVFSTTKLTDPATLLGHAVFVSALYAIGKMNESWQNGQKPPEDSK